MADLTIRTILVSVDDLDQAIDFYTNGVGLALKFRDGDHYAALDGGAFTLALATAVDHPVPGEVAIAMKTDDVSVAVLQLLDKGATVLTPAHEDKHEIRAVLRDASGTALIVYAPK